jgi:Cellulose binding domain
MTFRRETPLALLATLIPAYVVACAADPGDAPKGVGGALSTTSATVRSSSSSTSTGPSGSYSGGGSSTTTTSRSTGVSSTTATSVSKSGSSSISTSSSSSSSSVAPCTTCTLVLTYKVGQVGASTSIAFDVKVQNTGTGAQDLTQMTIRYYFTAEGGSSGLAGQVNSASISSAGPPYYAALTMVNQTFTALSPATATADTYDEISFGTGSLGAGDTLEVDVQLHSPGYATTFNQANDYSYDGTAAAFAPSSTLTIYVAGALAAGTAPM